MTHPTTDKAKECCEKCRGKFHGGSEPRCDCHTPHSFTAVEEEFDVQIYESGIMADFQKFRTELMSEMLDQPYGNGIYRTSRFYGKLDAWVRCHLEAAREEGCAQGKWDAEAELSLEVNTACKNAKERGRQQGLKEALELVPPEAKEIDCQHRPSDSCDSECGWQDWNRSHNACRAAIIKAIQEKL
jgi:hypothetical protein